MRLEKCNYVVNENTAKTILKIAGVK